MRSIVTLVCCLIILATQQAYAAKRTALVIGNAAYERVSRLSNPGNDAKLVGNALKEANFDAVTVLHDLKSAEMRRALRDFTEQSRDAEVSVVYFAGHGIEVDGVNYLVPVDAALQRDIDVYDEAVSMERVLQAIEPAKQLRLLILDACRDNPFKVKMTRTLATRSIGRGLAGVEPNRPNSLIAFAAKGGSTAADGDSKNSPFSTALAKHMTTPGLDIRKLFGLVRDDVMKATGNQQEPFVYGSLGGADFTITDALPSGAAPEAAAEPVRRDYELALQVGTVPVWTSFIKSYPTGFYSELAKAQRDKLVAEQASARATEKAQSTSDEQKKLEAAGSEAAQRELAEAKAKKAEAARVNAEKKKAALEAKVTALENDSRRKQEARSVAPARAKKKIFTVSLQERARLADQAGTYQSCMGPLPGCLDRALRNRTPAEAKAWCERRPTC